ncbi:MAG TPA: sigma-70 family RNA polymerase sigma factor [Candidatus Bathyarchaeia archaeon]|nr:sigma-70 family RNA polymerase sigma factor [Candidatus Bathyarchaeia archaeon]
MFTSIYTDQGIVRRVLRGNTDAFGILLDRYSHIVYGVAYARTGNAADAEEITQDTFVRLYQWLDRIAGRSSIGPWLVEVARNAATDLLRQRHRETPMAAPVEQAVAARDFARDELRRMVWDQLADLDETHREVLILHYFQAVKIREIARLLDISSQAAAKRLQRSRDELGRRLLDAVGEEAAATRPDSRRNKKVLAAIAAAPHAWQPSPALSLAGAAIVGASAAKVVTSVAAAAILIAIGLYAGWRHANRPYHTQNITAQSTFEEKATQVRSHQAPDSQTTAPPTAETLPAPKDAASPPTVPKAAVYGLVLDASFRPVAGATVQLSNKPAMAQAVQRSKAGYYPAQVEPLEMTTLSADDGSFYFDEVPLTEDPLLSTVLVTCEKGALYGEAGFRCPAGGREQYVEVFVGPAAALTVRVVDETGAGIPNAKVSISSIHDFTRFQPEEIAGLDGTLIVPRMVPGLYEIGAGQYGYDNVVEQRVLTSGKQTIVLTLGTGNSLSGRLTLAGDGRPIPDVVIRSYCPNRRQPVAKTDANGNFFMKGLDADVYEFNMDPEAAPYVIVDSPRVRVSEGVPVTGVEVQAVEGAYVSGTIRDRQTGEPVPHCRIYFNPPRRVATRGTWSRTYSDEDGRYTAGPLIPNAYEVLFFGSSGIERANFTLPALQNMENVDFEINGPLRIVGTVAYADGSPAPGAYVAAAGDNQNVVSAIADESGRFAVTSGAPGSPVYLQASDAGLLSPLTGPVREGQEYVLQLQPAARIEGTVVDTAGQPQQGMTVAAVSSQPDAISFFTPTGPGWSSGRDVAGTCADTSRTGYFQITPILPGAYELQVYAASSPAGYPAATAKASVSAGQTLHTRLVVDTGVFGSAEGRVIVNGAPLPGAFVVARCEGENWLGTVMEYTDADGCYRLSHLRPGKMRIRMIARIDQETWNREQEITVTSGETARVDFEVGETGCGFDGFVTFGAAPALAKVVVMPANGQDANLQYRTDSRGYYRAADLQEGIYDIQVQDVFSPAKVFAFTPGVEARENEVTRVDFPIGVGSIEVGVDRIREGELAQIAVYPDTADFSIISAALSGQFVAYATVSPGEPHRFDQIPAGIYYVGAVAVPANKVDDEATLLAQIESGKYAMSPVEVVSGETAPVNLTLP